MPAGTNRRTSANTPAPVPGKCSMCGWRAVDDRLGDQPVALVDVDEGLVVAVVGKQHPRCSATAAGAPAVSKRTGRRRDLSIGDHLGEDQRGASVRPSTCTASRGASSGTAAARCRRLPRFEQALRRRHPEVVGQVEHVRRHRHLDAVGLDAQVERAERHGVRGARPRPGPASTAAAAAAPGPQAFHPRETNRKRPREGPSSRARLACSPGRLPARKCGIAVRRAARQADVASGPCRFDLVALIGPLAPRRLGRPSGQFARRITAGTALSLEPLVPRERSRSPSRP